MMMTDQVCFPSSNLAPAGWLWPIASFCRNNSCSSFLFLLFSDCVCSNNYTVYGSRNLPGWHCSWWRQIDQWVLRCLKAQWTTINQGQTFFNVVSICLRSQLAQAVFLRLTDISKFDRETDFCHHHDHQFFIAFCSVPQTCVMMFAGQIFLLRYNCCHLLGSVWYMLWFGLFR